MAANSGTAATVDTTTEAVDEHVDGPLSKRGEDLASGTGYRVRSRTGQPRFRGGRYWPANSWARVMLDDDARAVLEKDKSIEIEPLKPGVPLDGPDLTDAQQLEILRTAHAATMKALEEAHAEIARLRLEGAKIAKSKPNPKG